MLLDVPIKMSEGCTQTEPMIKYAIEMSKGCTQTEPMIKCACNDVDDYEGICFMVVKRMDDFIQESTGYAALWGMPLVLVERKAHYWGNMLYKVWMCPCCGA